MQNITSRERVKNVLDNKIPDRIPIDFGTTTATGIMTIAYNKLRKSMGISSGLAKMHSVIMQLALPEKEIIKAFNIDVIDAGQNFLKSEADWKQWILNDGSRCLVPKYINMEVDPEGNVFLYDSKGLLMGKKPKSSLYIDQVYWPYEKLDAIPETFEPEDLAAHMWAAAPQVPWHLNIWDDEQFKIRAGEVDGI